VARWAASSGAVAGLTSSARASSFGAELDGYPFIAKADMCRAAIVEVIASAESWCPDRG
jgi:hypothetical protein